MKIFNYSLFYNILKKNIILNYFLLINNKKKINLNLYYINLYDMYILNKKYKKKKKCTDILSFYTYNFIFLCNLIIEKKSILYNIKIYKYYINILIHGFIHLRKINHEFIENHNFYKIQKKYII